MLPALLDAAAMNLKRKNTGVRLFEVDKVFLPKELPLTDTLPYEQHTITLCFAGEQADFFALKGVVENILDILHVKGERTWTAAGADFFHPGRKATLTLDGEEVGQLGELHPRVSAAFELQGRAVAAELSLDVMLAHAYDDIRFKPLPKYPPLERDLAVILPKSAPSAHVQKAICQAGGQYLESALLFDVYEGAQIGAENKSLAYALRFRSADGTLTDQDIAEDLSNILAALKEQFGAELR